jgi:hypothetical protein
MLSFLETIAKRVNIPIGALLCLLLVIAGIYTTIFQPHLVNRTEDIMIGAGLWGIAFAVCWFSYGEEFWMSPKRLDEFRSARPMENLENINREEK